MQFNAFDTVQVVLKDSKGQQLDCKGGRDATHVPKPLVIAPETTAAIYRNAILQWEGQTNTLRLTGSDGAGGIWYFDNLKPGKYTVSLSCQNNAETIQQLLQMPGKQAIDVKDAPFWKGKATTRELSIDLQYTPHGAAARIDGP